MCRTAIRSRRIAPCGLWRQPRRARQRFPVRPRRGRSPRQARRPRICAVLPSRSGAGRCDLCARTAAQQRRTSTCSTFRSGRGRASAAASWRAICSGSKTEIVGVQSTEAPSFALSFAAGTVVRTNSSNTRPTAWRRASPMPRRLRSSARAPRASSRSPTMRSPPRYGPTGPIRIISPRARAPPHLPRRCRRRQKSGASGSA